MNNLPTIRVNSRSIDRYSSSDSSSSNRNRQSTLAIVSHPWEAPVFPQLEDAKEIADRTKETVADILDARMRHNVVHNPSTSLDFWPPKLFDVLFQESDVTYIVDELINERELTVDTYRNRQYWIDVICGRGSDGLVYRRLLAILVLAGKPEYIQRCISERLADDQLPLDCRHIEKRLRVKPRDSDLVTTYQVRLSVPLFRPPRPGANLGDDVNVCHVDLTKGQVKPWDYLDKRPKKTAAADYALPITSADNHSTSTSGTMTLGGGFGEVHRIIIHPWQHEFHEILKKWSSNRNTFALKRLFTSDNTKFTNERNQLTRFGGQHDHIVTLLATISSMADGRLEFYLLFPWAEADLLSYWKRNPKPPSSYGLFRWIAEQCYGIVEAVAFIHDPGVINPQGSRMYGRHGDIKPENILWFKQNPNSSGMGRLVLSDLGLAAIHRDKSRSNIPGHAIPATPNYRPPECDMAGDKGYISRSFDIWTLGCLFLECFVWLLEGWEGRQEFRMKRCVSAPAYLNGETDVYFDIRRTEGAMDTADYFFEVKEQVTEYITRLHRHPKCTMFIHNFLDLIQNDMLIVQSDSPSIKRIKADELQRRVKALVDNCKKDERYCMDPCPHLTENPSYFRIREVCQPVRAHLNKTALDTLGIGDRFEKLPLYSGISRAAYPQRGHDNM